MRKVKEFVILLLILLGTGYAIVMIVCSPFGLFVGFTTGEPNNTKFWLNQFLIAICQIATSYALIKALDGPPKKKKGNK